MLRTMTAIYSLQLAAMSLGLVNRATVHPDGETPESVTTHTLALSLIVIEVGATIPGFDTALALKFAQVHDLGEADAPLGDVSTAFTLTPEEEAAKASSDDLGVQRMLQRLEHAPVVSDLLRRYEAQEEFEARFVRVLDKGLPKITALASRGAQLDRQGMSYEQMVQAHRDQYARFAEEYADQRAALDILSGLMSLAEEGLRDRTAGQTHHPED